MSGRAACLLALLVVATTGAASAPAGRAASTLEFRPLLAQLPPLAATTSTLAPGDRVEAAVKVATCDVAAVGELPVVPTTRWRSASPDDCVVYPDLSGGPNGPRYYLGPAKLTADDVARARAQFASGQGWTVKLNLTKAGSKAWDTLAEQQFHEQVALSTSGTVVAAPTIQPSDATFRSFGGVAVISADFTQKQARALALVATPNRGR